MADSDPKHVQDHLETRNAFADAGTEAFFSADSSPESSRRRSQSADASLVFPPGTALGSYELDEQLGCGGMGVVYRARQVSVGRVVALKVIRPDRLQDLSEEKRADVIARFRTEAKAAAQLEHDNIVTVYEVGEADGRHFFSMRLVEGQSLAEYLHEDPLENRLAAAYLEPVARAVHQAHGLGILHRDLKPQNILIDSKTGRPLVADFGLAKLLEADGELTHHGDVVGTPQYMSPEQAQDSSSVDAAADVYSIGATLYHAITGRPPFHAAQPWETIRQSITEDPVRPRLLNAAIDRDLETICLKCLEKEPARRYDSALELADELRRYLDGIPIRARAIGPAGRIWRWCRRNPVVASLISLAVILTVVTVVAVSYESRRARRAEQDERLASERARQAESEARAAINEYFTVVSEDELLRQDGMQSLRRRLLQKPLDYYRHLLNQQTDHSTIDRAEAAATEFRMAMITEDLESAENALPLYLTALEQQQQLVDQSPQRSDYRDRLGDMLNAYATALNHTEQGKKAKRQEVEDLFERALAIRERLFAADARRDFGRKLANTHMNLGSVGEETNRPEEALQQYETAEGIRARLLERFPDYVPLRRNLAMNHFNLAKLKILNRKREEGVTLLREKAIPGFLALLQRDSRLIDDRYRLAMCWRLAGQNGPPNSAAASYRNAIQIMKLVAGLNPDVTKYRVLLLQLQRTLGTRYLQTGDEAEGTYMLGQALKSLESLSPRQLAASEFKAELARVLVASGFADFRSGDVGQARQKLQRALPLLKQLTEQDPLGYQPLLQGVQRSLKSWKSSVDQ